MLSPNAWALCLAAFCVSFGWYFYPTYQPKFLKDVHGFEYKDSEILTGLPFLCGAAGCILGGRLSDRLVRTLGPRWGRSLIGVFGFSGAGLCFLVAGLVPYAWLAVTLLSLACFINDFAIPVIWATAADIGRRHAGAVSGFMNMLGGFGGMITPILIPVLLGALGGDLTALEGRLSGAVHGLVSGRNRLAVHRRRQAARCGGFRPRRDRGMRTQKRAPYYPGRKDGAGQKRCKELTDRPGLREVIWGGPLPARPAGEAVRWLDANNGHLPTPSSTPAGSSGR